FHSFWDIGCWSLANDIIFHGRIMLLFWLLAAFYGTVATASFQACFNIAMLMNPLAFGLANIIPQLAARARAAEGYAEAWRVSQSYLRLGLLVALPYYFSFLLFPELALRIFYGPTSPYLQNWPALQVLVVAQAASFAAEPIFSYLRGIEAPRVAFAINKVSAVIGLVCLPLTLHFGILIGSCLVIVVWEISRLGMALLVVRGVVTNRGKPEMLLP